jgi:hypothetical protein
MFYSDCLIDIIHDCEYVDQNIFYKNKIYVILFYKNKI